MSAPPPSPVQRSQLEPADALTSARAAARAWSGVALRSRLRALARFRKALAESSDQLVALSPRRAADLISSELIPLADACRFLERRARRLLRTRKLGRRGRPFWLRGVTASIEREALGAVLIIAPSNYPLLLPGVQALQALAAGNAAVIKPGSGGAWAADAIAKLVQRAGIPGELLQVLDESDASGRAAMRCGFDKVLFTGSADTGRKVLAAAAATLSPATVELSGCDAALVLPGADLRRAAGAIAFGLALNGGRTCIAPRRLLVPRAEAEQFLEVLRAELERRPPTTLDPHTTAKLAQLAGDAVPSSGGFTADGTWQPAVFADLSADHPLAEADLFAPVAVLLPFDSVEEAITLCNRCRYALGASVFGREAEARRVAGSLDVGTVTVNDLIVPTADPRLPFGGRGESGFGVTRGGEGLLELTRPKVVTVRRARWLPHLDPPRDADAGLFTGFLRAIHGASLRSKAGGVCQLVRAARSRKAEQTDSLDQ